MATKLLVAYGDTSGVVTADTSANASTVAYRDSSGNIAGAQVSGSELKSTALVTLAAATTQTASATLDATAAVWKFSTSSADLTATLPPASGCSGRVYWIKKVDSNAHNVIVSDGTNTLATLASKYATAMVQSDGTNWF